MTLYKEYIEVDEDFIPVFSDEVDRTNPKGWKTFIPHESFRNLLSVLIKALDRSSMSDKKPLWVVGAYGTGKTLGAFVIKHILEDDIEDVRSYFEKYPDIKPLYDGVKVLREGGPNLVVYKSSSSNITSDERLIVEVQQSIKRALEQMGYEYLGARTLFEGMMEKLRDEDSTFDFETAFKKHRIEHFPEFESHQDLMESLELERTRGSYRLTEEVLKVMEKEGFIPSQRIQDLKDWIKDVIRGNELKSIIFIWDEFTDYFRQNTAISALQELAQLSSETPFYLFLITHRDIQQFARIDEDARKVIEDRFNRIRFEMSNVTAYHLMANAIKIKHDRREEWEHKLETLWDMVENSASEILQVDWTTKKEDLRNLLPIHPYSAYLLSLLSANFSSNQRTMFRFLREIEPNNFRWFIETSTVEDNTFLTADLLWDYFFTDKSAEIPDSARRLINHYESCSDKLTNKDDIKVFKGVLLLMALNETLGGKKTLRPSKRNIELLFRGTNVEYGLNAILRRLCDQGMLNRVGEPEEYTIPMVIVDPDEFSKIRKEVEQKYSFENLAKFGSEGMIRQKLLERCKLSGPLEARFIIETSSINEADRAFRAWRNIGPYKVGVLLLVGKNDDELLKIDKLFAENQGKALKEQGEGEQKIILVNTNEAFSERKFNSFLDEKAYEEYADRHGHTSNREYHRKRAEALIDEWLRKLTFTRFIACFGNELKDNIQGIDSLKDYLTTVSDRLFKYGPEQISRNENIYKPSGYSGPVILMGMGEVNSKRPYSEIKEKLERDGLWSDPKWFETKRHHPLAMAKAKIEELVDNEKGSYIAHIWEDLSKPPFGYMPSQICAFLMGFLMKDYAKGDFYLDDGSNTAPANPQRLAEAIESVMKRQKNYELYKLTKMKPEHAKFCQYMQDIFKLPKNKVGTIRNVKSEIRRSLAERGFPIWSLKYLIEEEDISKITKDKTIDLLCDFISVRDEESINDEVQLAEKIYNELLDYGSLNQLRRINESGVLEKGMLSFIKKECSSLYESAQSLNVTDDKLLMDIKNYQSEDSSWLWKEGDFRKIASSLETDYKLLQSFNNILGTKLTSLEEAKMKVKERLDSLKVPLEVINNYDQASGKTLRLLKRYISENDRNVMNDLTIELKYGIRALSEEISILWDFIRDKFGTDLTEGDVKEIYKELGNARLDMPLSDFTELVKGKIDGLKKLNARKKLLQRWKELTNSVSPEDLSERYGVPISWIPGLDDEELIEVYSVIGDQSADLSKLEKSLSTLEQYGDRFAILTDDDRIRRAFIDSVAGDFALFVDVEVPLERIREEIRDEFGTQVYSWRNKQKKISEHVRRLFTDEYRKSLHMKVIDQIDSMSPEDVKRYLKEVVQSDPIVGMRILKNRLERR